GEAALARNVARRRGHRAAVRLGGRDRVLEPVDGDVDANGLAHRLATLAETAAVALLALEQPVIRELAHRPELPAGDGGVELLRPLRVVRWELDVGDRALRHRGRSFQRSSVVRPA